MSPVFKIMTAFNSSDAVRYWETRAMEDRGPGARKMDYLKRRADRISFLIVATDYPEIDLLIEEEKLREECSELFPDRMHLYEMIYAARFRRLKAQFRDPEY